MSLANSWGIKANERDIAFPCDSDGYGFDSKCAMYRAITIEASPEEVYLWLCQLRYSSCSYDLVGKTKRKALQATLYDQPKLEINQAVMNIFNLISFKKDVQITLSINPSAGYPIESLIVSYMIIKQSGKNCRLICKANIKYKRGLLGFCAKMILPWGDLVMMRKQMMNIKRFAERR